MKTMGASDDVGVAGVQVVIGVLSLMDGAVESRGWIVTGRPGGSSQVEPETLLAADEAKDIKVYSINYQSYLNISSRYLFYSRPMVCQNSP